MKTFKLTPAFKNYIWGGTKFGEWGKIPYNEKAAEAWELSFNDAGLSLVCGGENDGKPVRDVIGIREMGMNAVAFERFPMLIKLIDAAENLSVQVHPDDAYAKAHEHSYGKTEMWYVVEAKEGAGIYAGFKNTLSKSEAEFLIRNGAIIKELNFFPVKSGDCFFIEAGTVHAIGAGTVIAEIQQNSDITYRVFDYNRIGTDGKPRALHLDKAFDVMNLNGGQPPFSERKGNIRLLASCKYFTTYECVLSGDKREFFSRDSFLCLNCVSGGGNIDGINFKKGDSFFIPAGVKSAVTGETVILVSGVNITL